MKGRNAVRPAHIAGFGRGPGEHQRRTAARGAHPREPDCPGLLRFDPRRLERGHCFQNVNMAKGGFDGLRQSSIIGANDQISSSAGIPAAHRGLSEKGVPVRLTDVAEVVDDVENGAAGGLDERHARGDRQHPAPARRQRHRGRRQHQKTAAQAPGRHARGRGDFRSLPRATTIKASVRDVQFELMLAVGPGHHGDIPFSAHVLRRRSFPSIAWPGFSRGDFRGHATALTSASTISRSWP